MKDFFANLNPWIKAAIICVGVIILFLIVRQDTSYEVVEVEKTEGMYGSDYSSFEFDSEPSAPEPTALLNKKTDVRKKPVKKLPAQIKAKSSSSATGLYSIQVASFKEKSKADEKAGQVKKNGFQAEVVGINIEGKGTYYRVYIGRYNSMQQANAKLPAVSKKYKGSFVIKRKK